MTDQMKVNLVQRLAKATAEVGGKLKADKRNEEQKYNYVSADKILSACGQALAENGVMVIPSIVRQEITMIEYTNSYGKQGKRYDAVVDLQLKVTDGETSFEEPWFGMGSDYSVPDKALYKAITSGHKYFISKLFCIGEGNEDSEHDEPEGQPTKQPANGKPAPVPMLKPLTPLKPVTAEALVAEITGEPLVDWTAALDTDLLEELRAEHKANHANQIRNALKSSCLDNTTTPDEIRAWMRTYKSARVTMTPPEAAAAVNAEWGK